MGRRSLGGGHLLEGVEQVLQVVAEELDARLPVGPGVPLDGVVLRRQFHLDLLSRRYAMQVVCIVGAVGPARYGEIEATFGDVSSSTLSARLDELVAEGLLERKQYAEIPPRVEYDLTPEGEELCRRLEPLLRWVREREEAA